MKGQGIKLYGMSFANSLYSMDNKVNTFSLDLNSRLTDRLSNQFLATYSMLDDIKNDNNISNIDI